jgi:hypothetical protein
MTLANGTVGTIVTPVVDYEPRIARTGTEHSPPSQAIPKGPADRAHLHAVPPLTGTARADVSPQRRGAAAFADAALRTVLEVIDLRRPVIQLRPLMGTGLADSVAAFARATPGRRGAAVLRRTRLQDCERNPHAFEVAAAYSRDTRLHAIACRIELISTAQGTRWQVAALHIG